MTDTGQRGPKAADADVSGEPPAPVRADGLTYDPDAAVTHLAAASPALAALIDAAGPFTVRPEVDLDPFPYLLRSIVFQQLNGTAAATIHGRVLDLFGGTTPDPRDLLAIDVEQLRGAGLSANKTAAVQDLARHALDGALPTHDELLTLPDLEIVERMTIVRGIGPWTVHMLLLFHLGRPDVLPTGDFGVREGWRLLHGEERQPTPTQFRRDAEPLRPYRSVASWYLWRAVDLHRAGHPVITP